QEALAHFAGRDNFGGRRARRAALHGLGVRTVGLELDAGQTRTVEHLDEEDTPALLCQLRLHGPFDGFELVAGLDANAGQAVRIENGLDRVDPLSLVLA